MADSAVAVTAGSGTSIDTRTEATNGNHRQVVVLGDPSTNAGVAPVDATNGLSVTLTTALPAGTNAIGKLASNTGVDIGDVDVLSIIPGTGATNLGKAVDTATGATDTGVLALGTRDDALSALTPAEGDNVQLRVDANGALWTHDDALDAALSGSELQVDVVGALPAGTNNIGDVDVLSIVPGTGATNLGKAIDTATGGTDTGVLALATRDDALSALTPVEGDNVQLRTDANGALWTHDDALDAALSGNELQVDVVGALPAGTNAIGKLAANSGVDIGDVDVTSVTPGTTATSLGKAEDAGHSSGDTGVMALGVRVDSPDTALAGTALDYSPLATSSTGAVRTAPMSEDFAALANGPQVKKYYTNAGAVTDGIVWSPAAGKRWYVTDIFINVSAAATVTLEDDLGAGDAAVWKAELAANSGWSHSFNTPLFSGEDAADLLITTSAGNVYVMVTGYEI